MLSAARTQLCRRRLAIPCVARPRVGRLSSSAAANDDPAKQATVDPAAKPPEPPAEPPALAERFKVMCEVLVSKIGPAGAGWWAANAFAADSLGFAATDLGYFAITGLGDASAVFCGHSLYFLCKSAVVPGIDVGKEVQTGTLLAGATFLSGFVWQPICNVLETAPFLAAAAGVGVGCGSAFLLGLRGMRATLGGTLSAIEPRTASNLNDDAALSVAIGGATGTFVGVVVDFADNPFLGTSIAILATASTASGCLSSAKATCLGFGVTQTVQNLVFPRGANWIDGCLVDGTYKTG